MHFELGLRRHEILSLKSAKKNRRTGREAGEIEPKGPNLISKCCILLFLGLAFIILHFYYLVSLGHVPLKWAKDPKMK